MAREKTNHFYDKQGNPVHTLIGKTTGRPRPTTIKDARELGLLESVTTILKTLNKESLNDWIKSEVCKAAYSNPVRSGESVEQYTDRICDLADKIRDDAAKFGTDGHAALENALQGREYDHVFEPSVSRVKALAEEHGITFIEHEKRVVNLVDGYAGTLDCKVRSPLGMGIGDFKHSRTNPKYKIKPWDTYVLQLAAYFRAEFGFIPEPGQPFFCFNMILSSTELGRGDIFIYTAAEIRDAYDLFQHVLALRRWQTGYDPRQP